MHGIVFQHVGEMVEVEDVIHRHHLDVIAQGRGPEHHPANPPEPVDADLDHDFFLSLTAGNPASHCFSLAISRRMYAGSLKVLDKRMDPCQPPRIRAAFSRASRSENPMARNCDPIHSSELRNTPEAS